MDTADQHSTLRWMDRVWSGCSTWILSLEDSVDVSFYVRVILEVGEEGAIVVCICEEAVGVAKLMGWS